MTRPLSLSELGMLLRRTADCVLGGYGEGPAGRKQIAENLLGIARRVELIGRELADKGFELDDRKAWREGR